VRGCQGEGKATVDYCVKPPEYEFSVQESATIAPTSAATTANTEVLYPLVIVSDGGNVPLGLCQGDCDTDRQVF